MGYAVSAAFLPLASYASEPSRRLRFYHIHTAEKLDVCYFEGGRYVPEAIGELNYLFRDFRTDEMQPIDRILYDRLHALRQLTGSDGQFEIISGYRSPKTNEQLRKNSSGVAKRSYHMLGKALDVRLTGVSTADLRAAAISLKEGGVGYYPKSRFIHIDTGRHRSWQ